MPTGSRAKPRLLELVLIEPAVYFRLLSLDYQAEQFELFHRTRLTRWAHYVGTQFILWAFFVLMMGHFIGRVPMPFVWAALVIGWYVRLQVVVGLVASAVVAVQLTLAWVAWAHGFSVSMALVVLLVAAAALNASHSVEPVPPVLTGRGFEPVQTYWAKASVGHRARLVALNGCYLPLELVSAPRLFVVHVLRALHWFGWRPAWAADVRRRALLLLKQA